VSGVKRRFRLFAKGFFFALFGFDPNGEEILCLDPRLSDQRRTR
jgi:hypothetical protein